MQGTIKHFNPDRGFGFLKPDDGGGDLFFHVTTCAGGYDDPQRGDRVTFGVCTSPKNGKLQAQDVRLVSDTWAA